MSLLTRRDFCEEPEFVRNPDSGVPCTVYVLKSSADAQPRYIGQTSLSLERRLAQHLSPNADTPVARWARAETAAGNEVQIIALVPEGKAVWNQTEVKMIAMFREVGVELLNVQPGGGSSEGYENRPMPREARAKIAAAHKGKRHSQESIRKMRVSTRRSSWRRIERF